MHGLVKIVLNIRASKKVMSACWIWGTVEKEGSSCIGALIKLILHWQYIISWKNWNVNQETTCAYQMYDNVMPNQFVWTAIYGKKFNKIQKMISIITNCKSSRGSIDFRQLFLVLQILMQNCKPSSLKCKIPQSRKTSTMNNSRPHSSSQTNPTFLL